MSTGWKIALVALGVALLIILAYYFIFVRDSASGPASGGSGLISGGSVNGNVGTPSDPRG